MAKKQTQHQHPSAVGIAIFILSALVVGVLILGGGRLIMGDSKKESKPLYEIIEDAVYATYQPRLKYLQDKYGDEFIMSEYGGVFSTRFPNMQVYLSWDKEEGSYRDYYIVYLRQEELKEALLPIVEPIYFECKIFIDAYTVCPSDMTKDTTAEQLLETTKIDQPLVQLSIFTTKDFEEKDADLERFIKAIQSKKYAVAVNITYLSAENYAIINNDNNSSDMVKKEGFYFWEGNLDITPEAFRWRFRDQWREG